MAKKTIKALVEGGKASAGPPLGPALAQAKMNVQDVIKAINEKTAGFKGMQVPVDVIYDSETKEFDIKVGTPPTSSMIKKELGIEKLSKAAWGEHKPKEGEPPYVFDQTIGFDSIVQIAKNKFDDLGTTSLKNAVKQVVSSCLSGGVKIEGKTPKEILKEIDEGKWDKNIA